MKKLTLIAIVLLTGIAVKSQNYQFGYDANGNRITRDVIEIPQGKPEGKDDPKNETAKNNTTSEENSGENTGAITDNNTQNNNASESQTEKTYEASLGSQKITIYPNPTKGELKIDITNLPQATNGLILITDMQGRVIYKSQNVNSTNTLSIANESAGNYVMKIVINGKSKEWLVVKQ
ncbi:MAG: T9SS type A sorting domain-containing protein [Bacteroidales bacterium]|jgi:hypothetical protein